MGEEKDLEIFNEILASDLLTGFQGWGNVILESLGDNPSILWERIKWDPWTAMAIFEDMEDKDSTLYSCLEKRRDGVLSLPRYVKPASDSAQDKKIAAFVEETLEQYWGGSNSTYGDNLHETPFESFLDEALEAVGDGVTIGEKIFAEATDRIYIREVKFKPQHLFSFGDTALAAYSTSLMMYPQTGRLRLRTGVLVEGYGMGEALPEHRFFVFPYRSRKGNRWGSPLKRKCFWQTWIKKGGVKGWLRYIEKGSGTVVARYNDGAAKGEQQNAVDAATALQEENAIAIPKKFIMEVHEMVRNIGTSHKELVDDYCNAEIARTIVGQTLTSRGSDGGYGSKGLGGVHERVEARKIETDCKQLEAVVNKQIVRDIVFWQFGPKARLPYWGLEYKQGEDLNSAAERYGKLRKEVGLPLSKKHLYKTFQTPEPVDENDALGGQSQPEEIEDPLGAKTLEFSEKKTLNSGSKSNLKTGRFQRFRPSTIQFLDE